MKRDFEKGTLDRGTMVDFNEDIECNFIGCVAFCPVFGSSQSDFTTFRVEHFCERV